jgi:uncharacterized protein YaaN involved in tellurite resistance
LERKVGVHIGIYTYIRPIECCLSVLVANMGAYKWALQRSEAKVDELKRENAALREKLEDASSAPALSPARSNPQAQKHERLRQHIAMLEVENEKMREALLKRGPQGASSQTNGIVDEEQGAVVEGLRKRIKELESNAKEHVMKQVYQFVNAILYIPRS